MKDIVLLIIKTIITSLISFVILYLIKSSVDAEVVRSVFITNFIFCTLERIFSILRDIQESIEYGAKDE